MRKLTRGVIAAVLILVVLAVIGSGYVWYSMGQPLYQPGMARAGKNLRAPLTPPAQSADEQFWQVEEDIRLYHFAAGAGRNVLVIHGGPGYPYAQPWTGLESLTGDYQFHYYDQRGAGQSTRPIDTFASQNYYENLTTLDKTLGLGAQIADIERIRQILGEDKLILVGHSFGGFLASLYAAEFPEHVEALVLVAPADVLLMPAEDGGLFALVRERLPEDMRGEYDGWRKRYFDYGTIFSKSEAELVALNDEFKPFYYAAAPGHSFPEQGKTGGWVVHAIYFSMGQRHDYRAAMKNVTAPVLVLHGAGDLQSEKASRQFVEAFPNARFEVIESAAHFSFDEQPEAFGAVVGEFLDSLR
jgi:proline iminopeptidase